MVRLIPSSVFMKDPVDKWGKEKTIGLAEHAVRVHAPPIPYDRRGDVLFWEGFESPTMKGKKYGAAGGTVSRSTDTAKFGDFSLKCVTTAVAHEFAGREYYISDLHDNEKVGIQATFTSAETTKYSIGLDISYYDKTHLHAASIRWDKDTGNVTYVDSGGSYTTLQAVPTFHPDIVNWGTMKLVVDFSSDKYIRALVFGDEYDMSTIAYQKTAVAVGYKVAAIRIYLITTEAVSKTGYFDNFVLTEDEPK